MIAAISDSLTSRRPHLAADWAIRLEPGELRHETIERVTSAWAAVDPEASFEWLNSLPMNERQAVAPAAIKKAAALNYSATKEWASQFDFGEMQERIEFEMATIGAEKGDHEASQTLRELSSQN